MRHRLEGTPPGRPEVSRNRRTNASEGEEPNLKRVEICTRMSPISEEPTRIGGRALMSGGVCRRKSAKLLVISRALAMGCLMLVSSCQTQAEALHSVPARFEPNQLTSNDAGGNHEQASQKSPLNGRQFADSINDIQIECNSNNIVVTLQTNQGFNGMIYPKGLSKNSSCMMEYHAMSSNITYYLPLKSCNTMSTNVEDGVEYFNTVMVQPHRRLVTNQGRGYHIRCRYQTKERVITNQEHQLSVNLSQSTPSVMGSASMPGCTMRIYSANDLSHEVSAENVRIGDELQLIISLDEQDVYGMLITNCLVRDGMNWGEQPLIDDQGCPVDEEIMPEFSYSRNLTRASVLFQAHKFPYTSSVYYQCNVKLCFRDNEGCRHVPPACGQSRPAATSFRSNSLVNEQQVGAAGEAHRQRSSTRNKRWVEAGELEAVASADLLEPRPLPGTQLTIQVSSGLRVNEGQSIAGPQPAEAVAADSAAPTAAALTRDEPDDGAPNADGDPLLAAASEEQPDETLPENSANDKTSTSAVSAAAERAERQRQEREFCMSLRKFAIIVSLISLALMAAIIILTACLIQRRNRRKLEAASRSSYEQHSNGGYWRD